jgi:hypothetical protein
MYYVLYYFLPLAYVFCSFVFSIGLFFCRTHVARNASVVGVLGSQLIAWAWSILWGAATRDGWGPDAVSSTGMTAVMRVAEGMWPVWAVMVGILVLGAFGWARSGRRIRKTQAEAIH